MGIYADEWKKVLETNEVRQCSCCGGPVIVKGKTTKFYIPVDVKILEEMGFKYEKKEMWT